MTPGTARKLVAIGITSVALATAATASAAVTPIPPDEYENYQQCPYQITGVALQGNDANDVIIGTNDNDLLKGGGGADTISGLAGNDCIFGQNGPDDLSGGPDADRVVGDRGRDLLNLGDGLDLGRGGKKSDRIEARDGELDNVKCGKGKRDVAIVDQFDSVSKACEIVREENV